MSVIEKHLRQECDNTLDYIEQNILPELDKFLTVYHKQRANILDKDLQVTSREYRFLDKLLKIVDKLYL